jgi:hypothetical protein
MRKLVYFFAFYILMLTVIPCSPQDNCCAEEMNASARSGLPVNNKPEFPCSPFFACGANHGIVIPNLQLKISRPIIMADKISINFIERPTFVFIHSVWQPPKFA